MDRPRSDAIRVHGMPMDGLQPTVSRRSTQPAGSERPEGSTPAAGSPQLRAADLAEHYNERYYGDLAERYRRRTRFARQRIQNVFSLLPRLNGLRVLDLGCGMGTFTIEAARRGARAVGVDPMPEAVAAALEIPAAERVEAAFVLADAAELPIAAGTADLAIAADVTEHLDDTTLERSFDEAVRVLRPGGALLIYTPSPSHLFERLRTAGVLLRADPSHIGMRSAQVLGAAAMRAGFRLERIAYLPSHLPGWNLLERLLGAHVPLLRRRIAILARKPKNEDPALRPTRLSGNPSTSVQSGP